MRAAVAEALLGLLTHKARAATITGDLLESRGGARLRFWLDLASIGGALLTGAVCRAPLRTLWLALVGLIVWAALYLSTRAVAASAGLLAVHTGLPDCCTAPASVLIGLSVALIVSNWCAGFWLGFRMRAGELNPCVPLAAVWLGLAMVVPLFPPVGLPDLATAWYCLFAVPLLYLAPLVHGGTLGARCRA